MQGSYPHSGARGLESFPLFDREEESFPERITFTLNGSMYIYRTSPVLPEDAIVIWFFLQTEVEVPIHRDPSAIFF